MEKVIQDEVLDGALEEEEFSEIDSDELFEGLSSTTD